MPKVRLKQLAQDGATNGQVATFNSTTGLWEPDDVAAGSSHSRGEFGIYTQQADTTAVGNITSAQFCVGVGSSSTPSGITRFHIGDENILGQKTLSLTRSMDVGNILFIYDDDDPSKWWVYRMVAGTKNLSFSGDAHRLEVAFENSSGDNFAPGSSPFTKKYRWAVYAAAGARMISISNHVQIAMAANLNYHTYSDAGGFSGGAINKDLSVTSNPHNAVGGLAWPGWRVPGAGDLVDFQLKGIANTGTAGFSYTATLAVIKIAGNAFSTSYTASTLTSYTVYGGFVSLGELVIAGPIALGGSSVVDGDTIGVAIKRNNALSFRNFNGTLTMRMIVLSQE